MLSQLVDTIVVNSIFLGFGLGLDWLLVGKIIIASYVFKVLIALLDTPFIYWARRWDTTTRDWHDVPASGKPVRAYSDR